MIKNSNRGGFFDRQRKGVGVGEEIFFLALRARSCSLADVFEKKNKTTSVPCDPSVDSPFFLSNIGFHR